MTLVYCWHFAQLKLKTSRKMAAYKFHNGNGNILTYMFELIKPIFSPHLCCILMKHILTTIFLERKKTILEIISRLWSNRSTTAPLLSWKRGINSISQQLSICCHSNKAVDENIGSRVQRFKMHTYYLMLCVDVLCFSRRNKILFRKIQDLPLKSNYNFHISNSSLW